MEKEGGCVHCGASKNNPPCPNLHSSSTSDNFAKIFRVGKQTICLKSKIVREFSQLLCSNIIFNFNNAHVGLFYCRQNRINPIKQVQPAAVVSVSTMNIHVKSVESKYIA